MPQEGPGSGDVDLVVCDELLSHSEVAQGRAEQFPADGAIQRNLMGPARSAQPPHAMGEPGRSQPDLGVPKTQPWLPEYRVIRHEDVMKFDPAVAAHRRRIDCPDVFLDQ